MRAAVRGRDGVAVVGGIALAPDRPGHRPFDIALTAGLTIRALRAGEFMPPGERHVGRRLLALDLLLQMICQSARKLEHRLLGHLVGGEGRIAAPAYLDAGE